MSDYYRIDSHKLIFHPARVAKWLAGEDIYPLYIEIAPFGGCNHRCIFCALDYLKYQPNIIRTQKLKEFLRDIAARGTKSVMFAGEGEPLLHRDIAGLVSYAKKRGLDVAITTNGVLLRQELLNKVLGYLSWLRISLNAGTAKTYAKVHRSHPQDFAQVMANLRQAVSLRNKKKYPCVIGVQLLLLKQNYREVSRLAKALKQLGADYLIIKPYSQHPASLNRL